MRSSPPPRGSKTPRWEPQAFAECMCVYLFVYFSFCILLFFLFCILEGAKIVKAWNGVKMCLCMKFR